MIAPALPVEAVVPELLAALERAGRAVLVAPPGAGKTTRVPLAMLEAGTPGRILVLEPRRLAARAAAERMAASLGERAGGRVGYRMRGAAAVSAATRIEVVTEGILTRMLQDDPSLPGVGAIVFDEFHERSIAADLGLAFALEARAALRPDLRLLVMSATLEAAPVAALMGGAPVVRAEGRAFPVETLWAAAPMGAGFEAEVAAAVRAALARDAGGLLVFLPGEAEIRRVARLLAGVDGEVRPLYGAMPLNLQRAAIAPSEARKIVLATSIAETSLTIEGIRIVVDAGRARRARHDPRSGMTRLVTERASRAEADQRRGRAGRTAPGVCHRLWTRGEEGAMASSAPPEIETADLAALALELAVWGGGAVPLLTPPPDAALAEARELLGDLGALDGRGQATEHGRRVARLPLHPRLGHMLLAAGPAGATMAALLAARDPLVAAPADLALRLEALADPQRFGAARGYALRDEALAGIRAEARRLARVVPHRADAMTAAELAALAYPDRIGLLRAPGGLRYLLSGGKGAVLRPDDPLAGTPLLVATDLDGDPREARIRQATALSEAELRHVWGARIVHAEVCAWDLRAGRVQAVREERFGALVLGERPWTDAPADALMDAAMQAVAALGLDALGWTPAGRRLQARAGAARAAGCDVPDVSDAALAGDLGWLAPWLGGRRTTADLAALDPTEALRTHLGHAGRAAIDHAMPASWTTPLGRSVPIDWDDGIPAVSLRLQEMFGATAHPTVGPARLPLRLTLLSPAGRPVQVTTDLPGFWAASYADVRRDLRGRYPRHPWPEDPAAAAPTTRAKPR